MRTIISLLGLRVCHTIAMGAVERFSITWRPGRDASLAILCALESAERFAARAAVPPIAAARLSILVEELVSNALRHGAGGSVVALELTLSADGDEICLDLLDDGVSFDPTADKNFSGPNPESGGGVGLALTRTWADKVSYRREGGRNHLLLIISAAG